MCCCGFIIAAVDKENCVTFALLKLELVMLILTNEFKTIF